MTTQHDALQNERVALYCAIVALVADVFYAQRISTDQENDQGNALFVHLTRCFLVGNKQVGAAAKSLLSLCNELRKTNPWRSDARRELATALDKFIEAARPDLGLPVDRFELDLRGY